MTKNVSVKRIWQGFAPVSSRLAKECYEKKWKLCIIDEENKDRMFLSGEGLKGYHHKAEPFDDKFGRGQYTLLYYTWTPENKNQSKLL